MVTLDFLSITTCHSRVNMDGAVTIFPAQITTTSRFLTSISRNGNFLYYWVRIDFSATPRRLLITVTYDVRPLTSQTDSKIALPYLIAYCFFDLKAALFYLTADCFFGVKWKKWCLFTNNPFVFFKNEQSKSYVMTRALCFTFE